MIRQAISCDICGTEKRQTNHWFVAYEHAGELRVSGWTSRHRLRADSKHLCGQTCLHKLVDEFMAKSIAARPRTAEDDNTEHAIANDVALTSAAAHGEIKSSARLVITPQAPRPTFGAPPSPDQPSPLDVAPADLPHYGSRVWHAEAWQRERERELRATENHPDITARAAGRAPTRREKGAHHVV